MYNETTQAHYRHPRNLGRMQDADGVGEARVQLPSDNWIQLSLRVVGGEIERATFRAIGCAATVAAGSALTEWATGQSLVAATEAATPALVLNLLDGLPDEKIFCADLAAAAFQAAAEAAQMQTSHPAR